MIKTLLLLLLVTLFFSFSAPAKTLAGYYQSEKPPSSKILLQNVKILQGPSSAGIGHQGKIQTILGLHKQTGAQTFVLYYCYDAPKKKWAFGNRRTDGCFSDIILIPLDSGLWIMRSMVSNEWIILTESNY